MKYCFDDCEFKAYITIYLICQKINQFHKKNNTDINPSNLIKIWIDSDELQNKFVACIQIMPS